ERIGILKRTHGGAVKDVSRSYEPPFPMRKHSSLHEKELIAEEAVSFIPSIIPLRNSSSIFSLAEIIIDGKTAGINVFILFQLHRYA
nr:hypothetical protein [Spirochaetales bacterium]